MSSYYGYGYYSGSATLYQDNTTDPQTNVTQQNTYDDLYNNNLSYYTNLWNGDLPYAFGYDATNRQYLAQNFNGKALAEYILNGGSVLDGQIEMSVQWPSVASSPSGKSTVYLGMNNVLAGPNLTQMTQNLRLEVTYNNTNFVHIRLAYIDASALDPAGDTVFEKDIPLIVNLNQRYTIRYKNVGTQHLIKVFAEGYGNYTGSSWDAFWDTQGYSQHQVAGTGAFYIGAAADSMTFSPRINRIVYSSLNTAAGGIALTSGQVGVLPSIDMFHADADILFIGASTTLTWATSNATSLKLNGTPLTAFNGSIQVTPNVDTTYQLEATNYNGTAKATFVIHVIASNQFPSTTNGPPPSVTPNPTPAPTPSPITVGTITSTDQAILVDATLGAWKDTSPSPASPLVLGSCRNHTEDGFTNANLGFGGPTADAYITAQAQNLITNWGSSKWGTNTYCYRNGHTPSDGKAWSIGTPTPMTGYHFERWFGANGPYPYDDIRNSMANLAKYGGMTPMHVINYGSGGGYNKPWETDFSVPPDFSENTLTPALSDCADEAARYVAFLNDAKSQYRAANPMPANAPPVKFFEIGNEVLGNWERGNNRASNASKYAFNAAEIIKRMQAASPTPISCGLSTSGAANWTGPGGSDWSGGPTYIMDKFLSTCGMSFDGFIIHPYNSSGYPVAGHEGFAFFQENLWRTQGWPLVDKYMNFYTQRKDPWTIWATEFFYPSNYNSMDEAYSMRSVTYTADFIATAMNNNWPIVNNFCFYHGTQEISDNSLFRHGSQTVGIFKLQAKLAKNWGDFNLRVYTQNIPTFPLVINPGQASKYDPNCPKINVSSSTSKDGRYLYMLIVNRSDNAIPIKLQIKGFNPKPLVVENLFAAALQTTVVDTADFVTSNIDFGAANWSYTVKGASVAILQLESNGQPVVIGGGTPPPTTSGPPTGGILPSYGAKFEPPDGVVFWGAGAVSPSSITDSTYNTGMSQWNQDSPSWLTDVAKWGSITGKKPMLFNNYLSWQDSFNDGLLFNKITAKYVSSNTYTMVSMSNIDKFSASNAVLFPFSDLVNFTTHDADIHAMAKVMAALGKPVFFRPFYGMNDPVNPWCPFDAAGNPRTWTSEDFKTVWRKIYSIFQQEGAFNVTFVWSPIPGIAATRSDPSLYYPGNDVVDWVSLALHVEADGATTQPGTPWPTVKPLVNAFAANTAWLTKPIMVEFTTRRDYTGAVATYQGYVSDFFGVITNSPRFKAVIYNNVDDPRPFKLGDAQINSVVSTNVGQSRFKDAYSTQNTVQGMTNAVINFALSSTTLSGLQNGGGVLNAATVVYSALTLLTGNKVGNAMPLNITEEAIPGGNTGPIARYVPATLTVPGHVGVNNARMQQMISDWNLQPAEVEMLCEMARGAMEWQRYTKATDTLLWSAAAGDGMSLALVIYSLLSNGSLPSVYKQQQYTTTQQLRGKIISAALGSLNAGAKGDDTVNTAGAGDNSLSGEFLAAVIADMAEQATWGSLQRAFASHAVNSVSSGVAGLSSRQKMEAFWLNWSKAAQLNLTVRLKLWGFTFSDATLNDPTLLSLPSAKAELPDPLLGGLIIPVGDGANGFTLSGTARATDTGLPIAGVRVSVGNQLVTTTPDGSWFVIGLENGKTYSVLASKDGYAISPAIGTVTITGNSIYNFTGIFDGTQLPRVTLIEPQLQSTGRIVQIHGSNFSEDPTKIVIKLPSALFANLDTTATVVASTNNLIQFVIPPYVKSGPIKLIVNDHLCPDSVVLGIVQELSTLRIDQYRPKLTVHIRPMSSTTVCKLGSPFSIKPFLDVASVPPYTHEIRWGDGTVDTLPQAVVLPGDSGNKEQGVYTHYYNTPGTYLIKLFTKDSLTPPQIAVDVLQVTVIDQDSYQIKQLWEKLPRWLGNYGILPFILMGLVKTLGG
jgi:hypothetical protein